MRIRVNAGWDIDGKDLCSFECIYSRDGFFSNALDRRLEPSPQNGIYDQFRFKRLLDLRLTELLFFAHPHWRNRQLFEHLRRIAAKLVGCLGQNNDGNVLARLMQLACGHKAIATVVPFSANHANGVEVEMLLREFGYRSARILHQGERRHTIFFCGEAVDFAHLRRSDDLHGTRAADCAASASSLASCEGSPMAMR